MNPDAELTVAAVRRRHWECVRLRPREKRPAGARWQITSNADTVAEWFERGANVGLVCCQRTGVAVLDPDELCGWCDMVEALGQPAPAWVLTGGGKLHYYVRWIEELPAKLTWNGEPVGEIQRGPGMQQVVLPGSVHPSGGVYKWITESLGDLVVPINPVSDPLPELPGLWRAYLWSDSYAG